MNFSDIVNFSGTTNIAYNETGELVAVGKAMEV